MRWTLCNVRPWGRELVDIDIEGSGIARIGAGGGPVPAGRASAERVEGHGYLALPGLVNAHAHVDKTWWGQPWESFAGEPSTQARIAYERRERDRLGIPGVSPTLALVREFVRQGTTAVRTHVDVDLGVGLRGIQVVREVSEALGGAVDFEIVAFPQDGVLRRPGVLGLLREAAAAGVAAIGGVDPASIDRDPVRSIADLVDLAESTGVALDVHIHDRGDLGAFQFEILAQRTIAAGLEGRVNVSHGFALCDVIGAQQERLLDLIAEAGISWTWIAPVELNPLPWRGMRARGIHVGLGTDGIRDLWSPYGDGDMLKVATQFCRKQRLFVDDDLMSALYAATREAAPLVGRDVHDLVVGSRADIVLVDAENPLDALVRAPRRELVVAGGRIVARDGAPCV